MMATEPHRRVVVIQDASREVNSEAIQKATIKFSLKAGDHLIIVAILDWLSSPMGYMMRVDSSYFISTNKKIIGDHSKRWQNVQKNPDMFKLLEYCKKNEITFQIEVLAGPAAEVAFKTATEFQATRLVLDRQMHKEMKHYAYKFPCHLYKITSNNSIEKLKGLKPTDSTKSHARRQENVSNVEMIQGSIREQLSLQSNWSAEASTSSLGGSQHGIQKHQEHETSGNQETGKINVNQKGRLDDQQEQNSSSNEAFDVEKEFTNPLCSVCKNERPKMGWKKDFKYSELYNATQGFSQKNFLSEGGFGAVYKGKLEGMMIAVKQHKSASFQGDKEFKSEVNVLSNVRHKNVVMLLGSCSEGNNRLLVYEYVCNGSLDQHLSQHSRSPLSWEDRIKIAIGVANGLLHLHKRNIIHRDMRPNNILITHDHQPLLGDFGLARTQNQDSTHSTDVVGTLGYLAPEYAEYGKVSTKTDVYSFGVVLLQLITGMRTTDKRLGGRSLVGWARPLLRERNYPDLIDERIKDSHDIHQLFWMVRLAEKCLSRDPHKRLNMVAVVNALNGIVEGSICGIIMREYSPTRSDSFYSDSDSDDAEDDLQGYKSQGESESHGTESTASSSTSQMMQIIVRQPPSPPIGCISSSTSSLYPCYDQSTTRCEAQTEGHIEI